MTAEPLRWGVIGATSWVARDAVLPAMAAGRTADLVAVASRDAGRARDVAARFGARRSYGDYAAVLDDPDVEAVYIPLPNHLHAEWTSLAAGVGRHVLCEKPLGRTAAEVEAMQWATSAAGVQLVEAYMTQFHPRHRLAIDMARDGAVGVPTRMHATFTFPLTDAGNHRWRRDAGGGALLDVGVYCVAPLLEIAGREPEAVTARATPGGDGVDATTVATLDFGDGLQATVECSFERPEHQSLVVEGTTGTLRVERPFTCGPDDTVITLERPGTPARTVRAGGVNSYAEMIDAVHAQVRGGTARIRGAAATLGVARTLDRIAAAATR